MEYGVRQKRLRSNRKRGDLDGKIKDKKNDTKINISWISVSNGYNSLAIRYEKDNKKRN